jgi:selenocysteine lyase/cysteine desulfurase
MALCIGALVLVVAYHGTGQIPTDLGGLGVDFDVSGSLKWLLGGPGIVELYARPELVQRMQPTVTGWFAHGQQFAFDPESWSYWPDARRFELGTPAVAAVYAARAGLDMILEIGVDAIRERELQLVADLRDRALDAGLRLKLPADLAQHGGIVMFPAAEPAKAVRALAEQHIIVDYRPGHVRVSPYFYNTEDENARVVELLRQLI